jgi:putative acetyltransferase
MFNIRPERDDDAAAIHAVHAAAFPTEDEARLVDELRKGGNLWISLVAEFDGQVVGHIAFSPVTVGGMPTDKKGLGLAPVAVLPSHQRRGIGSALIVEGLNFCREQGYGFVVLLGHPEYYPRFGFRRASDFGLANEYGADEAFMVLEILLHSLPTGGLVRYGPEFGQWS